MVKPDDVGAAAASLVTAADLPAYDLAVAPPYGRSGRVIVDAIAHGPSRRRPARWHEASGPAVVEFDVTDEDAGCAARPSGATLLDDAAERAVRP